MMWYKQGVNTILDFKPVTKCKKIIKKIMKFTQKDGFNAGMSYYKGKKKGYILKKKHFHMGCGNSYQQSYHIWSIFQFVFK